MEAKVVLKSESAIVLKGDDAGVSIDASLVEDFHLPKSAVPIDDLSILSGIFETVKAGLTVPAGKSIQLVITDTLRNGLASGEFRMMEAREGGFHYGNVVKTDGGKIQGQVGFVEKSKKVAQVASGAYAIASILVAQSHLMSINRNISDIKGIISKIDDRLATADLAKLFGDMSFLRSIVSEIDNLPSIPWREGYLHILNDITRDIYHAQATIRMEIETISTESKRISDEDLFGCTKTAIKIENLSGSLNLAIRKCELLIEIACVLRFLVFAFETEGTSIAKFDVDTAFFERTIKNCKSLLTTKKETYLHRDIKFASREAVQKRRMRIHESLTSTNIEISVKRYKDFLDRISSNEKILRSHGNVTAIIKTDNSGKMESAFLIAPPE